MILRLACLVGLLVPWAGRGPRGQGHDEQIAQLRAAPSGRRVEVVEELLRSAPADAGESLARAVYAAVAADEEALRASSAEQRLELLHAAERAARRFDADAAAKTADTRARILETLGRLREARDERAQALAAYPRASRARPILRLGLAESLRQLDEYSAALAALEALESEIEGDPRWSALVPVIERVRSQTYIDFGMPDLASEPIRARWRASRAAYASGAYDAAEVLAALQAYVRLLKATGANAEVAEVGREFLDGGARLGADALELARLAILVGSSELRLATADPATAERGVARLRAALDAPLDRREELYARLALASAELSAGRLQAADEHVARARAGVEAWGTWGSRPESAPLAREVAHLAALEVRLALLRDASDEELRALEPRIDAALDLLLEHWDQVPPRAGGAGYLLYAERRAVLGESVRLDVALYGLEEGARRGLEDVLRVQTRGSLARRIAAPAPSLAETRAALTPEGHGLLVYVSSEGSSHVFALDAEHVEHAELSAADTLDALAARYVAHVSQEYAADELAWASGVERELAAQLSAELLPPRVARLVAGWSAIGICGLDTFGWVPFEWLPLRDEDFLGAARAVAYLVSIPFAVARAEEVVEPASVDVLLVGGAAHGAAARARWPELADVRLDAGIEDAIFSGYPPARRRILRGPAATPRVLADQDLADVGVLQFFAHTVLEPERERPTALVLSAGVDDGLVRCADVEQLAGPRLVLLATCRSSAGPVRRGDPHAADLGGAWLAAGARAVLLTRKDVTVPAATEISRTLHRELRAGATPAEALRRLRAGLVADFAARAPLASHLLHVVGLGHEAPLAPLPELARHAPGGRSAKPRAAPAGVLLVAAALVAAALARRRRRALATARSRES